MYINTSLYLCYYDRYKCYTYTKSARTNCVGIGCCSFPQQPFVFHAIYVAICIFLIFITPLFFFPIVRIFAIPLLLYFSIYFLNILKNRTKIEHLLDRQGGFTYSTPYHLPVHPYIQTLVSHGFAQSVLLVLHPLLAPPLGDLH